MSSGGDAKFSTTHTRTTSATYNYSGSGGGNATGVGGAAGYCSGGMTGCAPATINMAWSGQSTETHSHKYSTNGTVVDSPSPGTKTGSYQETSQSFVSGTRNANGQETNPWGQVYAWNGNNKNSATYTTTDNGTYDQNNATWPSTGVQVIALTTGFSYYYWINNNGNVTIDTDSDTSVSGTTINYPVQDPPVATAPRNRRNGKRIWIGLNWFGYRRRLRPVRGGRWTQCGDSFGER